MQAAQVLLFEVGVRLALPLRIYVQVSVMISCRIWNDVVPSSLWPGRNNPEKLAVGAVGRAGLAFHMPDWMPFDIDSIEIDSEASRKLVDGALASKEALPGPAPRREPAPWSGRPVGQYGHVAGRAMSAAAQFDAPPYYMCKGADLRIEAMSPGPKPQ